MLAEAAAGAESKLREVKRSIRGHSSSWLACLERVLHKEEVLSAKETLALCREVTTILMAEETVLRLHAPITLVGDIHGQWNDVVELLEVGGMPPETNYLFLGDFVDRGFFSVECMTLLFLFKVLYPSRTFMIRGNHEGTAINSIYGFYDEIMHKFAEDCAELYRAFSHAFDCLPLGALVDSRVLAIHGGLSPSLKNNAILHLSMLNRFRDFSVDFDTAYANATGIDVDSDDIDADSHSHFGDDSHLSDFSHGCSLGAATRRGLGGGGGLGYVRGVSAWQSASHRIAIDVMWSDPSERVRGFVESSRGMGFLFGSDVTKVFARANGLSAIYRAHQLCLTGFQDFFGKLVTTVWSAPNYMYRCKNDAAFCNLFEDGSREIVTFHSRPDALRRKKKKEPSDKPMADKTKDYFM